MKRMNQAYFIMLLMGLKVKFHINTIYFQRKTKKVSLKNERNIFFTTNNHDEYKQQCPRTEHVIKRRRKLH